MENVLYKWIYYTLTVAVIWTNNLISRLRQAPKIRVAVTAIILVQNYWKICKTVIFWGGRGPWCRMMPYLSHMVEESALGLLIFSFLAKIWPYSKSLVVIRRGEMYIENWIIVLLRAILRNLLMFSSRNNCFQHLRIPMKTWLYNIWKLLY